MQINLTNFCLFFSIFCVDTRLSINKELPTTKWRRDRRIRLSSEYHHNHEPTSGNSGNNIKPLGESNQTNGISGCVNNSNGMNGNNVEIPLDMSVTTANAATKPPPPPYREPLPGSQFSAIAARPSVITQAPKREIISNQENNKDSLKKINGNFELTPNIPAAGICLLSSSLPLYPKKLILTFIRFIFVAPESISMVDPVIDEHFRRSLGADYMNLFGKKHETAAKNTSAASLSPVQRRSPHPNQINPTIESSQPTTPTSSSCSPHNKSLSSPKASPSQNVSPAGVDAVDGINEKSNATIAMSVDDHFAKALGATWTQLQQAEKQIAASNSGQSEDDDDYFDDDEDMAAVDDDNSSSSSTSTPVQRKKDKSRKTK